jgi:DNA mismatch endonuclease, patch repair protein
VLKKYATVIYVHGSFWHKHTGFIDANIPKTITDFWENKLERNVQRNYENVKKLRELGW